MRPLDVLIPTYNRPAALAVTLASLCAQTPRSDGGSPFRVVLSDQSDGPIETSGEVRAVLAVSRAHGHAIELRVMARFGGCGVLPSGVYHLELPTTIPNREVDAPWVLPDR